MPDISNIQLNGNSVTVDKIILDGVTLPLDGGGGGGDNAMEHYLNDTLESYTVPQGVTSLHNYVFSHLTNLKSLTLNSDLQKIGNNAFEFTGLKYLTIPNTVTSIGTNLFENCTRLLSVAFPNNSSITQIPNYCFRYCYALESFQISNYVTTIGMYAFASCQSITSLTIPSSVTTIANSALNDMYDLYELIFNSSTPPQVGQYSNIFIASDILVPSGSVEAYKTAFPLWENRIFAQGHTHDYTTTELRYSNQTGSTPFTTLSDTVLTTSNVSKTNLKSLRIGNNVTELGNNLIGTNRISVFFGNGSQLEIVGDLAFSGVSLSDLHFNKLTNLTTIGYSSFANIRELHNITLPSGVTSIGSNAFLNCTNLYSVTVLATTPPTLGSGAFDNNASGRKIYVPAASLEAYKTAWSEYAADIEAIPAE